MIMPDTLDAEIAEAVAFFWNARQRQTGKQARSGVRDQGNRGAVTGGKQLDGFVNLARKLLILNGVGAEDIFVDADLELPGFYRPNKKWDLLVVRKNRLVAALEFKSQVGPSFGNNFNNRTEEAMGSALDLWTAYREGVFGVRAAPWLGYFMLLEECGKSTVPVRARSPHFPILDEFVDASYRDRYGIFCRKLVLERQYNAACFMTTSHDVDKTSWTFPDEDLSLRRFLASLLQSVG